MADDNKDPTVTDMAAWNEIWRNAENILVVIVSTLNIETIDLLASIIVKGKLKKEEAVKR